MTWRVSAPRQGPLSYTAAVEIHHPSREAMVRIAREMEAQMIHDDYTTGHPEGFGVHTGREQRPTDPMLRDAVRPALDSTVDALCAEAAKLQAIVEQLDMRLAPLMGEQAPGDAARLARERFGSSSVVAQVDQARDTIDQVTTLVDSLMRRLEI